MVPASRGVRTPAGPPIVAVHPGLLPGPLYPDGSSGRWSSRGRPRPGADDTPEATPLVSFSPPRRLGQSSPQNRWHLGCNTEPDARRAPPISPGVPWEGIVVRSPLPPSSLPSGSDARGNRMPPPSSPLAPPLRWGGNRPICFSGTPAGTCKWGFLVPTPLGGVSLVHAVSPRWRRSPVAQLPVVVGAAPVRRRRR